MPPPQAQAGGLSDADVFGARGLTDAEVFGKPGMTDQEVFGTPAASSPVTLPASRPARTRLENAMLTEAMTGQEASPGMSDAEVFGAASVPQPRAILSQETPDLGESLIGGGAPIGARRVSLAKAPESDFYDKPLVNFPKVGTAQNLADAMDVLRELFGHGAVVSQGRPSLAPEIPEDNRSLMERLGELPIAKPTGAERIATGLLNVPSETVSGLTSPKNLALLAGSAGVGTLPKLLQGLVSAGFAVDMGRATPELIERIRKAQESGDEQELTEAIGHLVVNTGMAAGAGLHGVKAMREGTRALLPELTPESMSQPSTPSRQPQAESAHEPDSASSAPATNLSRSALEELQAAMRGESKESVRLKPSTGQPEPAAATAQRPEPNAEAPAEPAKNYAEMSPLELELLEGMGDQGAQQERRLRAVRRHLAAQDSEQAPGPAAPAPEPEQRGAISEAGDQLAAEEAAASKPPAEFAPAETSSGYTIADAVSDAGGIGVPPLDEALARMDAGRRASQVVTEWSGGRGDYDALADVLEQIHDAAGRGRQHKEFRDLAAAYRRAFKPGGRGRVDQTLADLEESARETGAPDGGVPESPGALITRAWDHSRGARTQGPLSDVEHRMRLHDVASSNAGRSAAQNGGAGVDTHTLQAGDTFQMRGTGYRVRRADANGVLLEASGQGRGQPEQFGRAPVLDPNLTPRIYPDRGTFAPVDRSGVEGQKSSRELPRTQAERAFAALKRSVNSVFPGLGDSLRVVRRPGKADLDIPRGERERERAWRVFERVFDRNIVVVESADSERLPFQGVTIRGHERTLFLTRDHANTESVLGHEFLESIWLERPELYGQLRAQLLPLLKDFEAYHERLNASARRNKLAERSQADAQKDLIADFVGDSLQNPEFLRRLGERNPTLFKRLTSALIDFLRSVREKLNPYGAGRWFSDVEAAENVVMGAIEEFARRGERGAGETADEGPSAPEFSLADDLEAAARYLYGKSYETLDAQQRKDAETVAAGGRVKPSPPRRRVSSEEGQTDAPGQQQPAGEASGNETAAPGEVLARSIPAEQSARIAEAIRQEVERLQERRRILEEWVSKRGSPENYSQLHRALRELGEMEGTEAALRRIWRNFRDSDETRSGDIFFSLEPGPEERPFNLEGPESVDEQRARLSRERTKSSETAREQSRAEELARRRDQRLVGDMGEAGQGSLFAEPGQKELFRKDAESRAKASENRNVSDAGAEEPFFSLSPEEQSKGERLADEIRKLREQVRAARTRGETPDPELVDRMMVAQADLDDLIDASRRPRGGIPSGMRGVETEGHSYPVDDNLERSERPAERGRAPQFKGSERLPGGDLRDAFDALKAWRRRAGEWWTRRGVRETAALGIDAADNRADRTGNMAAAHVRLALNRSFGDKPGDVRDKHALREAALSFAIEADGDREALGDMHAQISGSEFAQSSPGRAALKAIEFTESNWERIQPVVDVYRTVTTTQRETELNAGVNSREWEGGYVHHAWSEVPKADLLTSPGVDPNKPQGAGTPFRKAREFSTFAEGIAAGGKPKSLNAIELLAKRVSEGQSKLNELAWIDSLRRVIDPVSNEPIVVDARKVPQSPTPNRSRERLAGGEPSPDDIQSAQPAKWERRPLPGYVATKIGELEIDVRRGFDGVIAELTAPSWWQGGPVRRGIRNSAALFKTTVLMADSFHLGREVAWKTVLTGKPTYRHGLTLLDYTTSDIREMAQRGEVPQKWTADLLENKRRLDLAMRSGLNVGGIVDNFGVEWISKVPGLGRLNHFVFREYQRGAVAEAWLLEFQRMRNSMPRSSEEEVARLVTKDLNVRFGSLGRQGFLNSRTAQDFWRILLLAPQWNESLLRAELGSIAEIPKGVVESFKNRRVVVAPLLKATGIMMAGTFLANQIINYITRGKPTWANEEEGWDKKISAYIPDQIGHSPGFFLNPLALPAEMTHLTADQLHKSRDTSDAVWRIINGRLSGPARSMAILISRRDPFGRSLKPGEVAEAMGKALIPIPIGSGAIVSAGKQVISGEPSEQFPGQFQKQLLSSFGVKTDAAPSPEQRIKTLAREFNHAHGIVPSAEWYSSDFEDLAKALRIGNMTEARRQMDDLLVKKTGRQIYDHYLRWVRAPYTGQSTRERQFFQGLEAEQQRTYTLARDQRRELAGKAVKLLRDELTAKQRTGAAAAR